MHLKCSLFVLALVAIPNIVVLAQKGGSSLSALLSQSRSPARQLQQQQQAARISSAPIIIHQTSTVEQEKTYEEVAPHQSAAASPVRIRPAAAVDAASFSAEEAHPAPEPYSFSYAVNDEESGAQISREESQDASGNIVGFYHMRDSEGRMRRVDYTAGPDGFRATVRSNEEGLVNRDSADALYHVDEVPAERQEQAAAAAAARHRASPGSGPAGYALAGGERIKPSIGGGGSLLGEIQHQVIAQSPTPTVTLVNVPQQPVVSTLVQPVVPAVPVVPAAPLVVLPQEPAVIIEQQRNEDGLTQENDSEWNEEWSGVHKNNNQAEEQGTGEAVVSAAASSPKKRWVASPPLPLNFFLPKEFRS